MLAAWHGHEQLTSRGAVLFRESWQRALALPQGPWSHPFNAAHPVSTPYGLASNDPAVQQAFGDALAAMNASHTPFNVALGTVQYVVRNGRRIPLPGGPGDPNGEFNAIYQNVLTNPGANPTIGSSYIQAVGWQPGNPRPEAATLLTYSQSSNPASTHYADQTQLFSEQQWVPTYFCPAQVAAHAVSTTVVRSAPPAANARPAVAVAVPAVATRATGAAAAPTGTLALTGLDEVSLGLAGCLALLAAAVLRQLFSTKRRERAR